MDGLVQQTKALASDVRLSVLGWLKEPGGHFPDQLSGDPEEVGVCVSLIAKKLGVSQPTTSRHLELLRRAGFVKVRRIAGWAFYARDEAELKAYQRRLHDTV